MRAGHASGRYDVAARLMAEYFRLLIVTHRLALLTTTETAGRRYRRAVRRALGREWRVQSSGEHLCITRRDLARPILRVRTVFTNQVRGLAAWRLMRPAVFHYRIDGVWNRVLVVHGPAGIQHGRDWSPDNPAQVENARKGWARLGRNMRRFQRRHPHAVQRLHYDGNLDLRDPRWLRWFQETLNPAQVIWSHRMPDRGTHGDRLIDAAQVLGLEVTAAGVSHVPRPRGLDHTGIWYAAA